MNIGQILLAAALAFFSKSATVKVGNYEISASISGGAPVHLNPSDILLAYEQFTATGTDTIQSGSTVLTVTKVA